MNSQKLINQLASLLDEGYSSSIVELATLGMNSEELALASEQIHNDDGMIERAIERNINIAQWSEANAQPYNHPVRELILWYTNRKSKKVVLARKELQRRFLYLDYDDQVEIITTMLKGGKVDLDWCFDILRKWWSEEILEPLIELWDNHHYERCGWLLTRHCTIEQIKPRVQDLCYDSNYYNLCKRLAPELWFVIDKEKLRTVAGSDQKYLWIMSHTPDGLPAEEAWTMIYKWIAIAIHYTDTDADPNNRRFLDGRNKDFIVKLNFYHHIRENFYLTHLKGMDKMLSSLIYMGYVKEVADFLQWDESLHYDFYNAYSNHFDYLLKYPFADEEFVADLYKKYVQFVSKQFPPEYRSLLDYWKVYADDQNMFECHGVFDRVNIYPTDEDYINATGDDIRGLSDEEKARRFQKSWSSASGSEESEHNRGVEPSERTEAEWNHFCDDIPELRTLAEQLDLVAVESEDNDCIMPDRETFNRLERKSQEMRELMSSTTSDPAPF